MCLRCNESDSPSNGPTLTTDMTHRLGEFDVTFPPGTDWVLEVVFRPDTVTQPSDFADGTFAVGQVAAFERREWFFWRADLRVLDHGRIRASTWVAGLLVDSMRNVDQLNSAVQDVVFRSRTAWEMGL